MSFALPWPNKSDITVHPNEYAQVSVFNRAYKRCLDNDKYLLGIVDASVVADTSTGKIIEASSSDFTSAGKYIKVEQWDLTMVPPEIIATYYMPLYTKNS